MADHTHSDRAAECRCHMHAAMADCRPGQCLCTAQARPEVQIVQRGSTISVADVQALVLWAVAEGQNPKWAFIKVGSSCRASRGPVLPPLVYNLAVSAACA